MAARGGRQRIPRPPDFRTGNPPPWAALAPAVRRITLDDVRAACSALPASRPPVALVPESSPAAVLIPLFEEDGEARVILTKRPETMPSHQGEIAFPGGKLAEHDETLLHAALREAEEEIGLAPAHVDVCAQLDGLATVGSRFVITPFVGLLDGRPALAPDPREVVSVFDVALSELMDDDVFHEERWAVPARALGAASGAVAELPDAELAVQFFELPGETVWGATARILTGFLGHLVRGRATGAGVG